MIETTAKIILWLFIALMALLFVIISYRTLEEHQETLAVNKLILRDLDIDAYIELYGEVE